MSSITNLKHIDEQTKYIVYGYIRDIENMLISSHNGNCYYLIPKEIGWLIITNIDDHFVFNRGTYQYIINNSNL